MYLQSRFVNNWLILRQPTDQTRPDQQRPRMDDHPAEPNLQHHRFCYLSVPGLESFSLLLLYIYTAASFSSSSSPTTLVCVVAQESRILRRNVCPRNYYGGVDRFDSIHADIKLRHSTLLLLLLLLTYLPVVHKQLQGQMRRSRRRRSIGSSAKLHSGVPY